MINPTSTSYPVRIKLDDVSLHDTNAESILLTPDPNTISEESDDLPEDRKSLKSKALLWNMLPPTLEEALPQSTATPREIPALSIMFISWPNQATSICR